MEPKKKIDEIKQLIANNSLKTALDFTSLLAEEIFDSATVNDVIILSARLVELNEKLIKGIISQPDYGTEKRIIIDALLRLLDSIALLFENRAITQTQSGILALKKFIFKLQGNSLLLNEEKSFTEDLKDIIQEVEKSYQVILDVISKFINPLFKDQLDGHIYESLSGREASMIINKGMGDLSKINNYYERKILPQLKQEFPDLKDEIEQIESLFKEFFSQKSEVFTKAKSIEDFICKESKLIADTILEHGDSKAREILLKDRKLLQGLRAEFFKLKWNWKTSK